MTLRLKSSFIERNQSHYVQFGKTLESLHIGV